MERENKLNNILNNSIKNIKDIINNNKKIIKKRKRRIGIK